MDVFESLYEETDYLIECLKKQKRVIKEYEYQPQNIDKVKMRIVKDAVDEARDRLVSIEHLVYGKISSEVDYRRVKE